MTLPLRLCLLTLLSAALLTTGGCQFFGYVAATMPKPKVKPHYQGMRGQSVAVMVWADRSIRIDYPMIQLDIANAVQNKLLAAQKDKSDELKEAVFPIEPRSIVRYQVDHPESAATPITEVAPVFNVSRLIYIEIQEFQTRPEASLELFRGVVNATVRVVEIDAAGKAKVVYEETEVRTVFPRKSQAEGVPNSSDGRMYAGVLEQFTTDVARLFFTYQPGDDDE